MRGKTALWILAFASACSHAKIYTDVETVSEYFQQGTTLFNTSMPNSGEEHYFTDNNPDKRDSGRPTEIYLRTLAGVQPVPLPELNVPADVHITPDATTLYVTEYGAEKKPHLRAKTHRPRLGKTPTSEPVCHASRQWLCYLHQ